METVKRPAAADGGSGPSAKRSAGDSAVTPNNEALVPIEKILAPDRLEKLLRQVSATWEHPGDSVDAEVKRVRHLQDNPHPPLFSSDSTSTFVALGTGHRCLPEKARSLLRDDRRPPDPSGS